MLTTGAASLDKSLISPLKPNGTRVRIRLTAQHSAHAGKDVLWALPSMSEFKTSVTISQRVFRKKNFWLVKLLFLMRKKWQGRASGEVSAHALVLWSSAVGGPLMWASCEKLLPGDSVCDPWLLLPGTVFFFLPCCNSAHDSLKAPLVRCGMWTWKNATTDETWCKLSYDVTPVNHSLLVDIKLNHNSPFFLSFFLFSIL